MTLKFDLLEDPTRGLHAVLTRFGIASRTDYEPLVTALVRWAADACRSSQPKTQNEQAWEDLQADGGLPESHDGRRSSMTVEELIEALRRLPSEKVVRLDLTYEGVDGVNYYGYVNEVLDESAAVTLMCSGVK